ncbi:U2 snRNP auxilliary factor, large subunit, splicing factor [Niveomyces insectorum RCEF 264]|uniref:Splicing factor U2AF subunit n=1 Tax=Niveomyces insectorum RCEF 264 TaxID=1081102 RepID=A0A167WZJ3_9HYPO|nr:U2 snRNP auxilliary factor, large subunit, splicing factor [Niveomyces insectorum RCEF 264]
MAVLENISRLKENAPTVPTAVSVESVENETNGVTANEAIVIEGAHDRRITKAGKDRVASLGSKQTAIPRLAATETERGRIVIPVEIDAVANRGIVIENENGIGTVTATANATANEAAAGRLDATKMIATNIVTAVAAATGIGMWTGTGTGTGNESEGWDIKPPGYESVAAEQAKLSGMFPLPGAPRQQAMDPSKLQAFIAQPAPTQTAISVLKPSNSRQAKRLVVSYFPPATTEEELVSFFNLQLDGLNVIDSTDPCVQCQFASDKSFGMLEFRDASDATVALALDGITMEDDHADPENGASGTNKRGLSIQRPRDYIVPAIVDYSVYQPGVVSQTVVDTPNKISITNIPPYLNDEQVTELLVSFGQLRAFILVKDRSTEESRGIAFCEYAEPASTDIAIQGLNGMELGDRKLKVTKASIGIAQVTGMEMGVNAVSMLAGTVSVDSTEISRVVQLLNMVTPDELMDNEDYEEICDDVRDECVKFGTVLDLKVPRPTGGSRQSSGVGKIFVRFDSAESATKALKALAGRKFADRTVVTTYFPEENYEVDAW